MATSLSWFRRHLSDNATAVAGAPERVARCLHGAHCRPERIPRHVCHWRKPTLYPLASSGPIRTVPDTFCLNYRRLTYRQRVLG
jgi:hypothetical protein